MGRIAYIKRLLAIDPGKHTGFAIFEEGMLVNAGVWAVHLKNAVPNDVSWIGPADIIIEIPQVYPSRLQKGDPNDLITVAFGAGLVAGRFPCARLHLVKPHQWKGTVPKEIHNRRVQLALNEKERAIAASTKVLASVRHNMIDAIGLGLWYLKRGL